MSNTITIELCTEDRARIDNLTAALIANGGAVEALFKQLKTPTVHLSPCNDDIAKMAAAVMSPENALQHAEETTQAETPKAEESPAPTEDTPPWEEPAAPAAEAKAEPTVTLAQIQQKVMQLATVNGGAKKAKVREIISTYGAKVSDLKDQPDKWTEVWGKLTALESEG
jgi:hypothetical protein